MDEYLKAYADKFTSSRHSGTIILNITVVITNQITKKEPISDDRLSKFDWHDLSPIFFWPQC